MINLNPRHIDIRIFLFLLLVMITGCLYAQPEKMGNKSKTFTQEDMEWIRTSADDFVAYLENDTLGTKAEKARQIYIWIIHNIRYDIKAFRKFETGPSTPQQVIDKRRAICYGYSLLFNEFCERAGIKSFIVAGYDKGNTYYPGKRFYRAEHVWNAFQLNNTWYLVDPTWGSGYVVNKESNFLKDISRLTGLQVNPNKARFIRYPNTIYYQGAPEDLIYTHLPEDPMWQLMDCPVPLDVFEKDQEAVSSFLNNKDDCTYFNFTDTLNKFIKLKDLQRNIYSAQRAHHFNPRNYQVLASAYRNNGIRKYNMAYTANPAALKSIDKYKNASLTLEMAKEYLLLEKDNIKNEYKANTGNNKGIHKRRLRENKSTIRNNHKIINKNKSSVVKAKRTTQRITKRISQLKKENGLIYLDEKIYDVKRTQDDPSSEDLAEINEIRKNIEKNNNTIKKYQKYLNSIYTTDTKGLFDSVYHERIRANQHVDSIISLMKTNIDLLSKNDPMLNPRIAKNEFLIKDNRNTVKAIRKSNAYIEKVMFKQSDKLVWSKFKEIKKLYKVNKKYYIDLKKLSVDDLEEEVLYDVENQNIIDENKLMIERYRESINNFGQQKKSKRLTNKVLKQEAKIVKKLGKVENIRYTIENKVASARYLAVRKQNAQEIKDCNALLSKCRKAIKEFEDSAQKK